MREKVIRNENFFLGKEFFAALQPILSHFFAIRARSKEEEEKCLFGAYLLRRKVPLPRIKWSQLDAFRSFLLWLHFAPITNRSKKGRLARSINSWRIHIGNAFWLGRRRQTVSYPHLMFVFRNVCRCFVLIWQVIAVGLCTTVNFCIEMAAVVIVPVSRIHVPVEINEAGFENAAVFKREIKCNFCFFFLLSLLL